MRAKSRRLTGYLEWLINSELADVFDVLTPSQPEQRGCQLSLRVKGPRSAGRELFIHLSQHGVIGDWREPDVIRVAPTPLYNRYVDCLHFIAAVKQWKKSTSCA